MFLLVRQALDLQRQANNRQIQVLKHSTPFKIRCSSATGYESEIFMHRAKIRIKGSRCGSPSIGHTTSPGTSHPVLCFTVFQAFETIGYPDLLRVAYAVSSLA